MFSICWLTNRTVFAEHTNDIASIARFVGLGLKAKVARSLMIPEQDVDTQNPIHAYGVDSLVAVGLSYWLLKTIQSDISVLELMSARSIATVGLEIAKRSRFRKKA